MKKLLLAFAIISITACHKEDTPSPDGYKNIEWVNVNDNQFHIRFTSDSMIWRNPSLTPNPSIIGYQRKGGDTIYTPSTGSLYVIKHNSDTLSMLTLKNNFLTKFYKQ